MTVSMLLLDDNDVNKCNVTQYKLGSATQPGPQQDRHNHFNIVNKYSLLDRRSIKKLIIAVTGMGGVRVISTET